jgi:hypothetical protein
MKTKYFVLRILFIILLLGILMINCQNNEKKPNTTGFLLFLLYTINNSNTANSTYPQTFADQDTAIIIDYTVTNLYNNNVAGTSGTTVNVSGNCSKGGTFSITGTATGGNPTTTNLSYALTGCMDTITFTTMTGLVALTGTITQTGTIGSTTNITRTTSSLLLKGTQTNSKYSIGSPINWNTTCAFTITKTSSASTSSVCGKSFSY